MKINISKMEKRANELKNTQYYTGLSGGARREMAFEEQYKDLRQYGDNLHDLAQKVESIIEDSDRDGFDTMIKIGGGYAYYSNNAFNEIHKCR